MNALSTSLFYGLYFAATAGGGVGMASYLFNNRGGSRQSSSSTTQVKSETAVVESIDTTKIEEVDADKSKKIEDSSKEKVSYSPNIQERIKERDQKRGSTPVIAQYVFRGSDGKEECGEWFQNDERPSESFRSVCQLWKDEEWYKERAGKNFSLILRANKDKAKDALKNNNIDSDGYAEPKENNKSEAWKIKTWYSCTSSYEKESKEKVIVECSKILEEAKQEVVKE